MAERCRYETLGEFLRAAQQWVNFYNTIRPHEGLDYLSPDQYAQEHGLPDVPIHYPVVMSRIFDTGHPAGGIELLTGKVTSETVTVNALDALVVGSQPDA